MKGNSVALHWPASSFENHGIKSSHDGSHNTAWADANLAISCKSWRKTESIYSVSVGFLPWGCLKNWDTIPVCKPCLHVIAPEPQNLNTCMCVCSHNRAYWPQSHGKSHSGLAHRRGRIFQFNYAWECNFTLTCGLLEIARLGKTFLLLHVLVTSPGVSLHCVIMYDCRIQASPTLALPMLRSPAVW